MSSLDRRTLAFVVPLKDAGKTFTLYIPMPDKMRADMISPILGYIFSAREADKISPLVIAKDYEYYAKEACGVVARRRNPGDATRAADELFGQFKDFLMASMSNAQVITQEGKALTMEEAKISAEALDNAIGLYVFFYSTLRFAGMLMTESDTEAWTTSLTTMELATTFKTLSSETVSAGEKEKV